MEQRGLYAGSIGGRPESLRALEVPAPVCAGNGRAEIHS